MTYEKTLRLTFGDYNYELRVFTEGEAPRDHNEYEITSYVYKALASFHEEYHQQSRTIAEMKRDMFTLARDRPDLVRELQERGLL